ncbi:hypothetical protein SNE40_004697 [Patella caerulea]|uniref:Uncharacterized protein n=1 Tax=Patella caerulea TaxID=87958 RepID=A0AAN8K620_PATCE
MHLWMNWRFTNIHYYYYYDTYIQFWKHNDQSKTIQHLNGHMKTNSKHDFYYNIKNSYNMENYLCTLNKDESGALSKFRLSAHKLEIEKGRYCKPFIPRNERLCENCNLQLVEDEKHFLLYCPFYDNSRQQYLSPFIKPNITDSIQLNILINNVESIVNVGSFVLHAFKKRGI